MSLDDVKSLYVLSCFLLCLIIASPTFLMFSPSSGGAHFSELWLLTDDHLIEGYPFNITVNVPNQVYLGVKNHLGSLAYYLIYVKLGNQSESLPNATGGTPSSVAPLFEYKFFLGESEELERLMTFSVLEISTTENYCNVETIEINDRVFAVGKSSTWDVASNGFFYHLFFELWLYNMTSQQFEYHDRFVGIWLNMTNSEG